MTILTGCNSDADCPFGVPPAASAIQQGIGVNIHFTDPQPGEIEMISAAGFRWVRMDFKWDATEPERGRYDFTAYDRLMKALEASGIKALFILDYGNPLYDEGRPPRTAETRRAFVRWALAAAEHFSKRGVLWEIYNEPNHSMFWPPKPNVDEYVALALDVGRAFRSALPDEKLIGPAVSEMDFAFLESCFKAGLLDYWAAVSVHPYRHTEPETAARDYCRLRKLIQGYQSGTGGRREIPIISGEWGYSAVWRGMSETKQGAFLARELLTNVANKIPLSIWYDWRDDGTERSEAEHHFGLVTYAYRAGQREVYEAKPAYYAARTFNKYFDGYVFEQRLPVGRDDDFVLIFSRAGQRCLAAWTTSTGSPHRINFPSSESGFNVFRHTGQPAGAVGAIDKQISLEVSDSPLYLIPSK